MGILVIIIAIVLLVFGIALAKCYKICPPDQIMVIIGANANPPKIIHDGKAFVLPVVQHHEYMSLCPMDLQINLLNALSKENLRVNVSGTCSVAISYQPGIVEHAVERFLGVPRSHIEGMVKEIIYVQLRLDIANMGVEEIYKKHHKHYDYMSSLEMEFQGNIQKELDKIGLVLVKINIEKLSDEAGLIDALAKKDKAGLAE